MKTNQNEISQAARDISDDIGEIKKTLARGDIRAYDTRDIAPSITDVPLDDAIRAIEALKAELPDDATNACITPFYDYDDVNYYLIYTRPLTKAERGFLEGRVADINSQIDAKSKQRKEKRRLQREMERLQDQLDQLD